jgi:uncharacterized membrane protein YccC
MSEELAKIDAEYREGKAKIRAFEDLTDEAKQRKVRALAQEHAEKRKEAEKAIEDRLWVQQETAYRKAFGPAPSNLSAEQETARELRLQRIRAEVTDAFEGGHQDPLINYERAIRAGDDERAEVIAVVGPKYLTDPARRQRLGQLVAQNEPAERRRAKETLVKVEGAKRTHELGTALNRIVRAKEGSNA